MDNYIRDIIYYIIFLLSPDCLLRNMPIVAGKTLFCCSNPRLCYLELEGFTLWLFNIAMENGP